MTEKHDWSKELPCFYNWDGVCQKDGAAVQIEEGQCDACTDFCVESWRWEQIMANCVANQAIEGMICTEEDKAAIRRIVSGQTTAEQEVAAVIGKYRDEVELTPSFHGEQCQGNGKHPGIECQCDNCDHYLTCFPDWREYQK